MSGRNEPREAQRRGADEHGEIVEISAYQHHRSLAGPMKSFGGADRAEEPGQDPKRRRGDTWQARAPRWMLISACVAMAAVIGGLTIKLQDYGTKDQARLETAIADAQSKSIGRLSERVAVVEEKAEFLRQAVSLLRADLAALTAATVELTTQVRVANAEMRMARGGANVTK